MRYKNSPFLKCYAEWDRELREACDAGVLPALADALLHYVDPDDYADELPLPTWLRKALLKHLEQMMSGGLKSGSGNKGTVWSCYRADMRHRFRWRAVKKAKENGSTWEESYKIAAKKLEQQFGYGSPATMKNSYQTVEKDLKDPKTRGRFYLARYPHLKLMGVVQ